MARDNDSGAFVLGMLLGTAAGVVVTLFTAPCSGEETIDGLRRRANRLLGKVEDAGTRAYDWATEPLKQGTPAGVDGWPAATAWEMPAAMDESPLVVDASEMAAAAEDLLDDLERDALA